MRHISLENKISLSRDAYLNWCSDKLADRLAKLQKSHDETERKLLMEEIQGIRRES